MTTTPTYLHRQDRIDEIQRTLTAWAERLGRSGADLPTDTMVEAAIQSAVENYHYFNGISPWATALHDPCDSAQGWWEVMPAALDILGFDHDDILGYEAAA